MNTTDFEHKLEPFLISGSLPYVMRYIEDYSLHLTITKERKTKHGDYRAPTRKSMPHRISVNGNLNKVSFSLTLLHEIAHMHVFQTGGSGVRPHGAEWKQTFSTLARPFFEQHVWPENLIPVLTDFFKNPRASVHGHAGLYRELKRMDDKEHILLEDLSENALFILSNGRKFRKGAKRRTRYICTHIHTNKKYLINGLASVAPVTN